MDLARRYWKGVVAFAVAVVGGGVAQGLINGAAAAWCTIVIGALATGGVVVARNQPMPTRLGAARPVTVEDMKRVRDQWAGDIDLPKPAPAVKKATAKKAAAKKKAAPVKKAAKR